jgi:hypothetical protein
MTRGTATAAIVALIALGMSWIWIAGGILWQLVALWLIRTAMKAIVALLDGPPPT